MRHLEFGVHTSYMEQLANDKQEDVYVGPVNKLLKQKMDIN